MQPTASRSTSLVRWCAAIDAVPEAERVATGIEVARQADRRDCAATATVGGRDRDADRPGDRSPAIGEWRPDGSVRMPGRAAHPAARHDAAHQCAGRAARGQPDPHRDRLGGLDRCRDGVHPAQRHRYRSLDALRAHCAGGGELRVLTTTYTGSTEAAALDRFATLGAEVRVSYDMTHDAAPRQGVAVPPALGLLDGLHRLVEPHALGAGQRARVERARVGRAKSGCHRQGRRGVRELLGSGDFVPYDARAVPSRAPSGTASRDAVGPAQPDRAAPRTVPGATARADRALARARPPPESARLGHGHGQDRDGGRRLRAPARRCCRARGCCSSPTARRSSTRASRPSATPCVITAFGELWVGGERPAALRARLRLDPEPQRRRARRPRPGPLRRRDRRRVPPRRGAVLSRAARARRSPRAARPDGDARAQRRAAAARLVRRPDRRRAAAVGRHRSAPARPRSPTTASTTGSTCATCPGGAAAATTSTALSNLLHRNDAWARLVLTQIDARRRRSAAMRALGFCVSVEHARFMARVFRERGHRRRRGLGRQPRRASGSAALARPRRADASTSSSRSTSSTRASTCRPSTPC